MWGAGAATAPRGAAGLRAGTRRFIMSAMPGPPPRWDLTRILLAVLAIGGLIAASYWVLRPFLPALVWAVTIVVATWPAMRALESRLGGRRGPAVAVMTASMLIMVVAP